MKKDAKEEETNKLKRPRGRPRKLKIVNAEELIPNSENNYDESCSENSSSSFDNSDDSS